MVCQALTILCDRDMPRPPSAPGGAKGEKALGKTAAPPPLCSARGAVPAVPRSMCNDPCGRTVGHAALWQPAAGRSPPSPKYQPQPQITHKDNPEMEPPHPTIPEGAPRVVVTRALFSQRAMGGVVAQCAHGAAPFRCFQGFYPVERPTTKNSSGCSQMLVDGHQRPLGDIWCFFLPCRAFFVTSWWV